MRNRGQFGTLTRAIKDHERAQELAAVILASECGVKHVPGSRTECPKCKQEPPRPQFHSTNSDYICDRCGQKLRMHSTGNYYCPIPLR